MNESQTRVELLKALTELSKAFPDWRLGQMIANLATAAGRMDEGAVWDIEDAEALAAAQRLLERRHQQVAAI